MTRVIFLRCRLCLVLVARPVAATSSCTSVAFPSSARASPPSVSADALGSNWPVSYTHLRAHETSAHR
eukprot:9450263-Alexandrium_andersonii.AAC.1